MEGDSQTLLDGTAKHCEVLFEKFGSIDSSYKACLLLNLIYLEFIGEGVVSFRFNQGC